MDTIALHFDVCPLDRFSSGYSVKSSRKVTRLCIEKTKKIKKPGSPGQISEKIGRESFFIFYLAIKLMNTYLPET